jgi:hypothetical protein
MLNYMSSPKCAWRYYVVGESCFCSNYGKIVCVRQINLSMDMNLYVSRYFYLMGRVQMVSQSFQIHEGMCRGIA